jgi:hypothetical protein
VIICGHDYTLYVDYDRGNFGRLDAQGKVTYMWARVDRDLIQPCRLALRFQDCVAVGLLVPGLICAGISAAATFLNGGPAGPRQDQTIFVRFVAQYMHADLQQPLLHPTDPRVTNYADWLYRYVRCGLSHSFALEWGHIEGPLMGAYLGRSPVGQPQINQNELLEDFVRGWNRYLTEVAGGQTPPLTQNFETRFAQIFQ